VSASVSVKSKCGVREDVMIPHLKIEMWGTLCSYFGRME
jgi:hypothetical protein